LFLKIAYIFVKIFLFGVFMLRFLTVKSLFAMFFGLVLWAILGNVPASAQSRLGSEPGKFDFYVLSLSWSPSFCEGARNKGGMQCAGAKPFSFIVHGLWPQFHKGYPEYCTMPAPELPQATISKMLDIMPAPGLIKHEWAKHGTCSGLSAPQYFENIRKARAAIKIPALFENVTSYQTISPQEVEEAFIKANPNLKNDMIAVQCSQRNLSEVRVCFNRDFTFASCPETDKRACRRDKMVVPPLRNSP
jgi:ribonuclease T2